MLHQGKWNGKQIVPAAWMGESVKPSQELNKSYGYLWWNNTTNKYRLAVGLSRCAWAASFEDLPAPQFILPETKVCLLSKLPSFRL